MADLELAGFTEANIGVKRVVWINTAAVAALQDIPANNDLPRFVRISLIGGAYYEVTETIGQVMRSLGATYE